MSSVNDALDDLRTVWGHTANCPRCILCIDLRESFVVESEQPRVSPLLADSTYAAAPDANVYQEETPPIPGNIEFSDSVLYSVQPSGHTVLEPPHVIFESIEPKSVGNIGVPSTSAYIFSGNPVDVSTPSKSTMTPGDFARLFLAAIPEEESQSNIPEEELAEAPPIRRAYSTDDVRKLGLAMYMARPKEPGRLKLVKSPASPSKVRVVSSDDTASGVEEIGDPIREPTGPQNDQGNLVEAAASQSEADPSQPSIRRKCRRNQTNLATSQQGACADPGGM